MKKDAESKVWVTVVKLIIGAVILIGGVGLALWYAASKQVDAPNTSTTKSWGIAGDSPVHMKR